jgi:hypothetical protein
MRAGQQYSITLYLRVTGIELPAAIVATINRKTEQLRFTPTAIGARVPLYDATRAYDGLPRDRRQPGQ